MERRLCLEVLEAQAGRSRAVGLGQPPLRSSSLVNAPAAPAAPAEGSSDWSCTHLCAIRKQTESKRKQAEVNQEAIRGHQKQSGRPTAQLDPLEPPWRARRHARRAKVRREARRVGAHLRQVGSAARGISHRNRIRSRAPARGSGARCGE